MLPTLALKLTLSARICHVEVEHNARSMDASLPLMATVIPHNPY